MSDVNPVEPDEIATARLRKADVWTGGVLALVALFMIGQALTFPLRGTYAGVKNAWYVSPALLPIAIGGMLLVLSIGLLVHAAREYRRLMPDGRLLAFNIGGGPEARTAWLTAAVLTAYVVGLVPRVDFIVSTALFLVVFMALGTVGSFRLKVLLLLGLAVPSAAAFAIAMAGTWPAPRSPGQITYDWIGVAFLTGVIILAFAGARANERQRLRTAVLTALIVSVVCAAAFKDGLLIPLPREGLGVATLDALTRGIGRLFG